MYLLRTENWKQLINVDTPPCVSLYMYKWARSDQDRVEFQERLDYVQALLSRDYEYEIAQKMMDRLEKAYRTTRYFNRGTLVFFVSPEIEAWTFMKDQIQELTVVSDSFHIRPLFERLNEKPNYNVVYFEKGQIKLFEGSDWNLQIIRSFPSTLSPQELFHWIESRYSQHALRPILFAGDKVRLKYMKHFKKSMHETLEFALSDLGALGSPDLNRFSLERATQMMQVNREEVLLRLNKSLAEGKIKSALGDIVEAIRQKRAKEIYTQKGKYLWGQILWNKNKVQHHPYQKNSKDDDVVDDIIEEAIRKKIPIYSVPAEKWPFSTPLISSLT